MLSKILLLLCVVYSTNAYSQNEKKRIEKQKPNIIFILTDDLGYGDLGVFFQNQRREADIRSEPWFLTPNLDKMAASGARLTNHYCSAPVCAPARASLLSGLHQGHANVRNNQFDKALADNHTLGTVLQTAGYSTSAIGKWGLQGLNNDGPDWPAHPLNRGFDFYFGYIDHRAGHEHYPVEGLFRGKQDVWQNKENIASQLDKCFTTDLWTAMAKKWIIDHKNSKEADQPFFMYLAYDTPHAAFELPTQAYPSGKGLRGGMQWLGKPGQMINTASGQVDSWIHPDYEQATYDDDTDPSTPEVAWPDTYKRYATMIRRLDDAVEDIMQLLVDLGMDSNTMVVFTSDNGPTRVSMLPEQYGPEDPTFFDSFGPFDGIKRDVWEGGVRMPTLVSWPSRIPENRIVDNPSMFSDWMTTFCDAAGVAAPALSDGVSLMPSLTGEGKQQENFVYIEYFNPTPTPEYDEFDVERRGAKRHQMQLIRFDDLVGVRYDIQSANDDFEIYDVVKDPKETNNLAVKPEMALLQKKMKEKILQVRRPDTSAVRPYDEELIPAISAKRTISGISWKFYEGRFPWVSSVVALQPSAGGNANSPIPDLVKEKEGMLFFEGYFKIPKDGDYTFFLNADKGTLLRIHEATVIDADFGYKAGTEYSGTIKLKAGFHPFRLYYHNKNGGKPILNFIWKGPDFAKQTIPENVFYR